jgi:glycosyltransferase involved in cell wall biosynthesis
MGYRAATMPAPDADAVRPLRGDGLVVAYDVGPLAGRRTGVGAATSALRDALADHTDVTLLPYLTSFRTSSAALADLGGAVRLPVPAAVAQRLWSRFDHPRADRWLRGAAVVHGTNYVVPPTRLPRLVSVYDCWFLDHPASATPDVARAGQVLLRSLAGGAVAHVSSEATAARLRHHAPDADVRVVPLGTLPLSTPSAVCPIADLDGRPFVVAIGTIERRKNLPTLVRAFGQLAAELADLHLVIAGGDGDDRPALDVAIDAVGADVAHRIHLTGYVDDSVRSWLVHHAQVLAYPSLDEGFGFPLLDAMQADLPVVAARAGSIPEVAGDAALLVDPTDVVALAEALRTAVSDDATRHRLIAAGRARAAHYTWERTASALANIYRELADGASGRSST